MITVSTSPQTEFVQRSRYSDLTPVPITVTGAPGTTINVSWRTAGGAPAPLSDWQLAPGLAASRLPASGTAVVALPVPTGGPYFAAVRDHTNPADHAVSATAVISGDIHLWSGQSLGIDMYYRGDRTTPAAPPLSRMWTPGAEAWVTPTGTGANVFLQVLSLMTPGVPHAIQFETFGGASLTEEGYRSLLTAGPQAGFFLNEADPKMWGQIVADMNNSKNPAVGIDFCDIIWDQGQNDTASYLSRTHGVRSETYAGAVVEMIDRLKSHIVRRNPFVFIAPIGVDLYPVPGHTLNVVEILHGQEKAAATIPNAHMLPKSSDLEVPDLVHMSIAGNATRGARFAAAIYAKEY